jgi:hypothetical protein
MVLFWAWDDGEVFEVFAGDVGTGFLGERGYGDGVEGVCGWGD